MKYPDSDILLKTQVIIDAFKRILDLLLFYIATAVGVVTQLLNYAKKLGKRWRRHTYLAKAYTVPFGL